MVVFPPPSLQPPPPWGVSEVGLSDPELPFHYTDAHDIWWVDEALAKEDTGKNEPSQSSSCF